MISKQIEQQMIERIRALGMFPEERIVGTVNRISGSDDAFALLEEIVVEEEQKMSNKKQD